MINRSEYFSDVFSNKRYALKDEAECYYSQIGHYNFWYPDFNLPFSFDSLIVLKEMSHWIAHTDFKAFNPLEELGVPKRSRKAKVLLTSLSLFLSRFVFVTTEAKTSLASSGKNKSN